MAGVGIGTVTAAPAEFPQATNLDQVTLFETVNLFAPGREAFRYNPDDLVGSRGLQIYARMLSDEQVKAVTEFKLSSILARGWELKYEDSDLDPKEQEERIDVLSQLLERVRGGFTQVLENVATGREMGYSVTEKVRTRLKVKGEVREGFVEMRLRDPRTFYPVFDAYGNLQRVEQRASGQTVDVVMTDVVQYVHKPKWDSFYGRSELRSAYRWYYIKEQITRLWALYLERFGAGFAAAKRVDDSAPTFGSPEFQALQRALDNLKALSYVILPRGVELEMHYPTAGDVYEKCLIFCDLAIAKSQLVPNLVGVSHQSGTGSGATGSRANGETQFDAFLWTTKADADALAACVNEQVIRDLGDQNWGDGDYPCFAFKPASNDVLQWTLTVWQQLVTADIVVKTEQDEAHIRKLLNMPERNPDDANQVLTNPLQEQKDAAASDQEQANVEADRALEQQRIDQQGKQAANSSSYSTEYHSVLEDMRTVMMRMQYLADSTFSAPSPGEGRFADGLPTGIEHGGGAEPHGELRGVPRAAFDQAAARVHFSVIEERTNQLAEGATPKFAELVAVAAKHALGSDEQLQQILREDPASVAHLDVTSVDRGKLRKAFADLLGRAYGLGSQLAVNETDRAVSVALSVNASLRRRGRVGLSVPRPALASARFNALQERAASYFEGRSYTMAGDLSDRAAKALRTAVTNGIKYGTPLAEVRANYWDALVRDGLTTRDAARGQVTDEATNQALDALWQDTEAGAAAWLDTAIRTSTFEALNEARFNEFTDPALGDFVQALRYAAVLDSSTTEICRELNDATYASDSPLWDTYRPPNHFNCRSVLVPITAVDGWDGVESPPPEIEPQEGFK